MKPVGLAVKCALFFCLIGTHLARASASPAVPAPDLEALFQRTNGWIGADVAYSVALDEGTSLWLYGDTLVGEVSEGKRRNAKMINNSIALQSLGHAPQYFYRTNSDGTPASVFAPDDGTNSFFWPWDGARTARGLFLFFTQVRHTDDKSAWGFQLFSASCAFVSNPDSPPASWKTTLKKEPWADFRGKTATAYGWSAVKFQNYIYVYGTTAGAAGATVARAPQASLDDFAQWRFFSHGQWQDDPKEATPIFPDKPPEALSAGCRPWVASFSSIPRDFPAILCCEKHPSRLVLGASRGRFISVPTRRGPRLTFVTPARRIRNSASRANSSSPMPSTPIISSTSSTILSSIGRVSFGSNSLGDETPQNTLDYEGEAALPRRSCRS